MDRKRAAARQARAMSAQAESTAQIAERLDRMQGVLGMLVAPPDGSAELVEAEPSASAAQVAELAHKVQDLATQLADLTSGLAEAVALLRRIDERTGPRPVQQQPKR